MLKTSICVLHVTDREGGRQISMCVSQLTVRDAFCRGLSFGSGRWRELRWKRDARRVDAVERHELFLSNCESVFGGLGVVEAREHSAEDPREMW